MNITDTVQQIKTSLQRVFIGQENLVELTLCAIIADGHILVESLPGMGKTLLIKALARILGLEENRIQFTPDLMPSDITGSHVFDMAERKFVFHRGPVFTQFLLADEFNRSPAKTHAALLEVMQEGQVTQDGHCYQVGKPFIVLATQNPIENEGTYNLPEAQLDRFLIKLTLDYPDQNDEERILALYQNGQSPWATIEQNLQPMANAELVLQLQKTAAQVTVDQSIITYITKIIRATRSSDGIYLGASPRASVALLSMSRAYALLNGRSYVIPDDVKDLAVSVLRHRIILTPEAEIEGRQTDDIIRKNLASVAVPQATHSRPEPLTNDTEISE